ncbi:MAG: competence protein ComEA [Myxococcota bacterium]|jgi:competence protein ComEA
MFRIVLTLMLFLFAPFAMANPVDINSASISELDSLPGIGPSKAQAIVTYRSENGPFSSVADLDNVPGIGSATLEGLRDQVSLGDGAAPAQASTTDALAPAAAPAAAGPRINVNLASASELQRLPGVGATKASAIVEDRTTNGPFTSCNDLVRVMGIGPATVSSLSDQCAVE